MCFFELQTTAKDYAKQSHEYFQLLCRLVLLISFSWTNIHLSAMFLICICYKIVTNCAFVFFISDYLIMHVLVKQRYLPQKCF